MKAFLKHLLWLMSELLILGGRASLDNAKAAHEKSCRACEEKMQCRKRSWTVSAISKSLQFKQIFLLTVIERVEVFGENIAVAFRWFAKTTEPFSRQAKCV